MLLIFIRIQKFKLNLCIDEFLEDKLMPTDEPKNAGLLQPDDGHNCLMLLCTLISCARHFVAIRFQVRFACNLENT